MRVLHLIDPMNPAAGPCGAALLADLLRAGSGDEVGRDEAERAKCAVLLLGGSGAERLARDVGLTTHDRIAWTVGSSGPRWLSLGALRRYLHEIGPVDLIHAWSIEALTAAAVLRPAVPKVLTLTMGPRGRAAAHWLRILSETHRLTALAVSNAVKRAWARGGVDPAIVHVLRPGLDLARIRHADRRAIREGWGIASDDTLVLTAVGDPPARVDALRAGRAVTLACLAGLDAALVVAPRAARREVARMVARGSGGSLAVHRVIADERAARPWEILPACDVALALGDDTRDPDDAWDDNHDRESAEDGAEIDRRGLGAALRRLPALLRRHPGVADYRLMAGPLPMLWAAAAGRAIVADSAYAVTEVFDNRRSALLTRPGDDIGLTQRLRELAADPHLAWTLRDAARSDAFSFFSRQRYRSDMAAVYDQVVSGEAVHVPALPLTAGAAFAGRA